MTDAHESQSEPTLHHTPQLHAFGSNESVNTGSAPHDTGDTQNSNREKDNNNNNTNGIDVDVGCMNEGARQAENTLPEKPPRDTLSTPAPQSSVSHHNTNSSSVRADPHASADTEKLYQSRYIALLESTNATLAARVASLEADLQAARAALARAEEEAAAAASQALARQHATEKNEEEEEKQKEREREREESHSQERRELVSAWCFESAELRAHLERREAAWAAERRALTAEARAWAEAALARHAGAVKHALRRTRAELLGALRREGRPPEWRRLAAPFVGRGATAVSDFNFETNAALVEGYVGLCRAVAAKERLFSPPPLGTAGRGKGFTAPKNGNFSNGSDKEEEEEELCGYEDGYADYATSHHHCRWGGEAWCVALEGESGVRRLMVGAAGGTSFPGRLPTLPTTTTAAAAEQTRQANSTAAGGEAEVFSEAAESIELARLVVLCLARLPELRVLSLYDAPSLAAALPWAALAAERADRTGRREINRRDSNHSESEKSSAGFSPLSPPPLMPLTAESICASLGDIMSPITSGNESCAEHASCGLKATTTTTTASPQKKTLQTPEWFMHEPSWPRFPSLARLSFPHTPYRLRELPLVIAALPPRARLELYADDCTNWAPCAHRDTAAAHRLFPTVHFLT